MVIGDIVGIGVIVLRSVVPGRNRTLAAPETLAFGIAAGAAAVLDPGTKLCKTEDVLQLCSGTRQQAAE
jgi:hypothetical protein